MINPVATYRLQFHKDFTFEDFNGIINYLHLLGVHTVYASPIFAAIPGSTHGYDVVNPLQVNPEIGTYEELKKLSAKLKEKGILWLQDIVPNHMAFHPKNIWLMDVLEKGRQSVYATFFDVAWTSEAFRSRLMVPFLGNDLNDVIANKELVVGYANGHFVFHYFDAAYPLNPKSYRTILQSAHYNLPESIQQFIEQINSLHAVEDPQLYSNEWHELLLQLAALMKHGETKNFIQHCLSVVNNNIELIQQIEKEQVYQLCHWQQSDTAMNYRRFFIVNALICLNIQEPQVFEQYHQLILQAINDKIFQGIRVDHIDGLYNPDDYLQNLRTLAGVETYIIVEKILAQNESLPQQWPVQGTTGYEFSAMVNQLLTQEKNEHYFTQFYSSLVTEKRSIEEQVRNKKAFILYKHMAGELENLYHLFAESNLADPTLIEMVGKDNIKKTIGEFLIFCPVYRYYANDFPLNSEEAKAIQDIFENIKGLKPEVKDAVALLEDVFLKKPYEGDAAYNKRALHFYLRCMQFSGPLMAKGVEDTFMYNFNRFIGHNEVGDTADSFGIEENSFHKKMVERQKNWPLSLNATATHDTKRGEDFRARLLVLSNLPDVWLTGVKEWQALNADIKINNAPDVNDEYFIYQTLIGSFPFLNEEEETYKERLLQYVQKSLREEKVHSNWSSPDEGYEQLVQTFITQLLNKKRPFWKSFQKLQASIVDFGIVNSLVQLLLKFTCPGVPDTYQGCELWDLSFVDPDNRRPVDYKKRQKLLKQISSNKGNKKFFKNLWKDRYEGGIKLWLTHILMQMRQKHTELFTMGVYIPLVVQGSYKDNVIAFARKFGHLWYVVVAPLHIAEVHKTQAKEIFDLDWKDTAVKMPKEVGDKWKDVLQDNEGKNSGTILVNDLFKNLPLALLSMETLVNERGAGVLLHLTSLPSAFGIGDLGIETKKFVDDLFYNNQKYWQVLPINPTEAGQNHSPYSSVSSLAGNPLLISPEMLAADGLLTQEDLLESQVEPKDKVDFVLAEKVKNELFDKAWFNFRQQKNKELQKQFDKFCEKENDWLPDFALYTVIKKQNNGKPWFEWSDELKNRKHGPLKKFAETHKEEILKVQWLQFVFAKQWKILKAYCHKKNIQLIGDLPFYVSHDSADVWAFKKVFSLNEDGSKIMQAGVPPDAFSDDGQLWGMPVFRWDVLKKSNYSWWLKRLKKNVELFDILRLDHFRAFADYWAVPANADTAKEGKWEDGPGHHFFEVVKKHFGKLPFLAEDLGEIDDKVHVLRDAFNLPGIKVLQFAFGDNFASSEHAPHNYTPNFYVYTGTHDNNTSRGWYINDADEETQNRLAHYANKILENEAVAPEMCRIAYESVAKIVVLPMQDILSLGEEARMNKPASISNNWQWRLLPGQFTKKQQQQLKDWVITYNRI